MKKGYQIIEIANVHAGDLGYFKDLINSVSEYNSERYGLKLQVLRPDSIALADYAWYNVYEELYFNKSEWSEIINLVHQTKDVWIDVFDLYGAEIVKEFQDKIHGVKFQASVLDNKEVFEALSKLDLSNQYVIVNISGFEIEEIQQKLDFVLNYLSCKELILQVGYQAYPTSIEKSGLAKIAVLNEAFDYKIIYADHTDGVDDDALLAPILALYAGAYGIEKHIMLDRETKYDFQASLTVGRYGEYIKSLNKHLPILQQDFITDTEADYLKRSIQKPVISQDIRKGQTPEISSFYFRRTNSDGLSLDELRKYCAAGYVVNRDLKKDEVVKLSDLSKPTIGVLVACRLKSTRLESKALLKIGELNSIETCLMNSLRIKEANHVVLATSSLDSDSDLANYTLNNKVSFKTGSPEDVIDRYIGICNDLKINVVFRVTGDCPYVSHEIASELYTSHIKSGADYSVAEKCAVGTGIEIINVSALKRIKSYFPNADYSEYMTWYFINNEDHFKINRVKLSDELVRDYRLTLDYKEDLDLFNKIQNYLDESKLPADLEHIYAYLDENPDIVAINSSLSLTYKTDQSLIDTLNKETKINL